MQNSPTLDPMPFDLRMAAIVTLLSACALRGTTSAKADALRAHLAAAADESGIDHHLRNSLLQTLAGWLSQEYCAASTGIAQHYSMLPPKQHLH